MATWRQCGEYYLNEVWYADDRHMLPRFAAGEVTCDLVHDLCVRYSVARTIPGHIEELGVEGKYRPFVEVLNKYRDIPMTGENVPGIIDREVQNLRRPYGGVHLWSAVSKAFWMMKKHPVIIYDNFAWQGLQRLGLKPGEKTYREYFDSWLRFSRQESTKEGLNEAENWLPKSPYTRRLFEGGEFHASELKSAWFRDRIIDIRLCDLGGAPWLKR